MVSSLYATWMLPFESTSVVVDVPTTPVESRSEGAIAPPVLYGVAVGDMAVSLVKVNELGE